MFVDEIKLMNFYDYRIIFKVWVWSLNIIFFFFINKFVCLCDCEI